MPGSNAEARASCGERLQRLGFWNDLGSHEHDDAAQEREEQKHEDTDGTEDAHHTSTFFTESEAADERQDSGQRSNPAEPSRQAGSGPSR
jgi:hypothetical protein